MSKSFRFAHNEINLEIDKVRSSENNMIPRELIPWGGHETILELNALVKYLSCPTSDYKEINHIFSAWRKEYNLPIKGTDEFAVWPSPIYALQCKYGAYKLPRTQNINEQANKGSDMLPAQINTEVCAQAEYSPDASESKADVSGVPSNQYSELIALSITNTGLRQRERVAQSDSYRPTTLGTY